MGEIVSPNADYTIKSYHIDGGSLTGNSTVNINGKKLNVLEDTYDWRKNR